MQQQIQELQDLIMRTQRDLENLKAEYYKNNFTGRQDFNKYSDFRFRLKVPHYASTPTNCETGEICEVGGILYIASASDTWTKVGTQS